MCVRMLQVLAVAGHSTRLGLVVKVASTTVEGDGIIGSTSKPKLSYSDMYRRRKRGWHPSQPTMTTSGFPDADIMMMMMIPPSDNFKITKRSSHIRC